MPNSRLAAVRAAALTLAIGALTAPPVLAQQAATGDKLDPVLQSRAARVAGRSRVIVEFTDQVDVRAITSRRGRTHRRLAQQAMVAEVDNLSLAGLAGDPRVSRISVDRLAFPTLARAGAAIGATSTRQDVGVTGRGIGIAVIDSGLPAYHDDLSLVDGVVRTRPAVVYFKDFTNSASSTPSDEYGHGTHVGGILAGSGYDSGGARAGVAPGAHLVGLKVIDGEGFGYISDVIAAIDEAIAMRRVHNIRVINLSVASGVYESYHRDPLARAAKRAYEAGIVVVAAAGNMGTNDKGEVQFGGITSPGNSPWVITVGAASHQGTPRRSDDIVSDFSSRGPTYINFDAKPDLVAPGVGIESLADPNSTLSQNHPEYLLNGTQDVRYQPYLSLSGTSMAAPFVAGTVALMLEANPKLTPNSVKALLQYTAEHREGISPLAQGAGLLNTAGAVRMARFFADPSSEIGPAADVIEGEPVRWSRHILWGNFEVRGGLPLPGSNAWDPKTTWGDMKGVRGRPIVWGARTVDGLVRGAADSDNIVWATAEGENIVWATGGRHHRVWATAEAENIVWATAESENIVWATGEQENIVWATGRRANIVWATGESDNIVWATRSRGNIVWATASARNIVWGADCGGDNCARTLWGAPQNGTIWGTAAESDNIVWATSESDNIVWATSESENIVWATSESENIVWATSAPKQVVWPSDVR